MDSKERDEHPREQRGWPFRKEEGHECGCACVRLCVFLLQLAAAKEMGPPHQSISQGTVSRAANGGVRELAATQF